MVYKMMWINFKIVYKVKWIIKMVYDVYFYWCIVLIICKYGDIIIKLVNLEFRKGRYGE